MAEGRRPYPKALAGIDQGGRKFLETGGTIEEVRRFPRDGFYNRFSVLGVPDARSTKEIQERIIAPLKRTAQRYGVGFHLANERLVLHTTIQEGTLPSTHGRRERRHAFRDLAHDPSLRAVASDISGITVPYEHVLIGKGGQQSNVLFAAHEVPPEIDEARDRVTATYTDHELQTRKPDILHMTVGRVRRGSAALAEDSARRADYLDALTDLREGIENDGPVPVTLDVYAGPTWPFIHRAPDKRYALPNFLFRVFPI